MPEKLIMKPEHWQAMRRHVSRCAPLEACGLLAGKTNIVERTYAIRNEARSPVRFRMEPCAQWRAFQNLEASGLDLIGIYHSHPCGPDHPSLTDITESMYAVAQVIWVRSDGRWLAHGYRFVGGKAIEITIELVKFE